MIPRKVETVEGDEASVDGDGNPQIMHVVYREDRTYGRAPSIPALRDAIEGAALADFGERPARDDLPVLGFSRVGGETVVHCAPFITPAERDVLDAIFDGVA